MSRRHQLLLYVFLSAVDFAATVYLVGNGFADEANPLINGFTAMFESFSVGLALYKIMLVALTVVILGAIHRRDPRTAGRMMLFANFAMLTLGAWHVYCLRVALGG